MPEEGNDARRGRKISRRTFHKIAIGTGAAFSMGGALKGCAKGPADVGSETRNLYFDLSNHSADSSHELRVAGKRYPLAPLTPDLVAHLKGNGPDFRDKYNENYTHHVADVPLSAEKPHLFYVTTYDKERGNGVSLVGFHVPTDARLRQGYGLNGEILPVGNPVCKMQDQLPDEFITGYDTAKSIVMHHPEIVNLNKEIAAQVEVHICRSADVANLAQTICRLGPAYEHDTKGKFKDGWAVLVPKTKDGKQMLDRHGKQIYDYRFNHELDDDLKSAVRDVLYRIKNDPALQDRMYAVRTHNSTPGATFAEKVVERFQLWAADGVQMAATNTGYNHNVWFKSPAYTGSGSTRSFTIDVCNMNFIWYGVYLEYLNAAGKAIDVPGKGSMLASLEAVDFNLLSWMESSSVKWENIMSSPPTIFGVPLVPYPSRFAVTMPDGASAVRIMLCGPGAFGKVDFGPSLAVGIITTSILQYALPTYFIYSGKGLNEDATLWDVLKQKGMILKLVLTTYNTVKEVLNPSSTQKASMIGSIQGLLASLLEDMIVLLTNGSMPEITKWVVGKTSEEEAEDAIPFVGWVIRILALVATVADLVATSVEIGTNPLVIDNIISFTNSVAVKLNCDPQNNQFPEEATYYELSFTVTGAAYPATPRGFALSQADRGSRSFTVTVDGVPTTGQTTDAVDVWFYSGPDRKWLAGHGSATFVNQPAAGGIKAEITISQNPIPLSATTEYSQHRKLEFIGGKYVWNEDPSTLKDPIIEPSGCTAGICELTNISVWVPGGMLGYAWEAGGQYIVKNVNSQEKDPNPGMKLLPTGLVAPTPVAYDQAAPYRDANLNGRHFYLDPVSVSIESPAYHLRKLSLDPQSGIFRATGSWGRFAMQLDRIAVHPLGYVVGISTNNHKMAVLKLPDEAYADDVHANNATLKLGYGDTEKFIKKPQSMTISSTNAILILQGESTVSVKAFDLSGNPWLFFNNGTASSFTLSEADAKWLEIAVDDTDLIYILSYTGTGMRNSDYRLDVYDKNGSHIFRNVGIAVARMVVDKWRRVYTLNQEVMMNSPLIEPTVSVWMPSVP